MLTGKRFVSSVAAMTVLGTSAAALAAANPFTDVPAEHWAYDAVAQLAKDGVIEGYGDGTYIGEAAITRYEMAQMVARAMTKSDLKHTDKALLQKLAAEFSDELAKLGVRVSNLEKKVDNVKYRGSVRYIWRNVRHGQGHPDNNKHDNYNDLRLILWSGMEINKNWTARSRIQYVTSMDTARNCPATEDDFKVDRLYVTGHYGDVMMRFGKFDYESMVDDGMMFGGDNSVSGGQIVFGKDVKVSLMAGRYTPPVAAAPFTLDYQAIEIYSNPKNRFTWGLGYNIVSTKDRAWYASANGRSGIWEAGLGWKFDRKWHIIASYSRAHNIDDNARMRGLPIQNADKYAYSIALNYGRMNPGKTGDVYGFIAYRHLSHLGLVAPRLNLNNAMSPNQRGLHFGIGWTFAPRMVATFEYFTGKDISNYTHQSRAKTLFGRLEAFF